MKKIFEILSGSRYYYIVDENGEEVEETAHFEQIDWARCELYKQAAAYMEKEAEEADRFGVMTTLQLEIKDDAVFAK